MKIVKENKQADILIKKSKFISYSFSVNSNIDAKTILDSIKKDHPGANKHIP